MSAPGSPVVAAPAKHWKSAQPVQLPQVVDCGTQSATHSSTLPTISCAPHADMQCERDPVGTLVNTLYVLQSAAPSSPPLPSGVPATAICQSAFDGKRLRAFAHACWAWNQVMYADGVTPGMLRA